MCLWCKPASFCVCGVDVCWLLNVPATCRCISRTDLLNFTCCHSEIDVLHSMLLLLLLLSYVLFWGLMFIMHVFLYLHLLSTAEHVFVGKFHRNKIIGSSSNSSTSFTETKSLVIVAIVALVVSSLSL